jgi:hypothetical protein
MVTAGGTARLPVMIDEREPGSEFADVAVARPRTNGRIRTTDAPSPAVPSLTPTGVPDRRPARAATPPPEDIADFPVRLARSMQAAARAYRTRVGEEINLRRLAILAAIRDERRADAILARQTAAKNRRAVDAWAATAQRQIKSERQRRKVELDAELRRTLRDQNRLVDRRVKAVEAALATHRAELDAFFDEIEGDPDPVAIARHAWRRPAFPDLDTSPPAEASGPSVTE